MIELRGISKTYGRVRANDAVSVRFAPGRIYALVGENGAGKSTLMRVLAGHTRPDQGLIELGGETHRFLTPARARDLGVGMLYQDPLDFPAMPVWENFRLGGHKRSHAQVKERLAELGDQLGACLLPEEPAGSLTVGERQLLELLRLLDVGARTLILDEPTTGITPAQKRDLFGLLKNLAREEKYTIILVTHKLAEALDMADRILVMRRGALEAELQPPYSPDELVRLMFGEAGEQDMQWTPPPRPASSSGRLALSRAVFAGPKYSMGPIDFTAGPGEVVGLAGLEGSGQELLLRGLCGLDRMPQGSLALDGREVAPSFPRLRQAGAFFVPSDRMDLALFPELSVLEHVALIFPEQRDRLDRFIQEQCVGRFNLRASPDTPAASLSGGNQQRLLLSLIPETARLLLMEHPTRGLDAGSAHQVWAHLRERCAQGATLLFFSPDLEEILEQSHRILVFHDHALAAEVSREEADVELLGALMAGEKPGGRHAA